MKEVVIFIQKNSQRGNAVGYHLVQEGYKFFRVADEEEGKVVAAELIEAGIDPFATITCLAAEDLMKQQDIYELKTWGQEKNEPYRTHDAFDVVRKLTDLQPAEQKK